MPSKTKKEKLETNSVGKMKRSKTDGNLNDCIFCRVVRGELNSRRIYEDDASLVILDINPVAEGHCLVIPKRHVQWFHELGDSEVCQLFKVAKNVAAELRERLKANVVCTLVRGLRIPHVHIILIPSSEGDIVSKLFALLDAVQGFPPWTKKDIAEKLAALKSTVLSFSNQALKDKLSTTEAKVKMKPGSDGSRGKSVDT